MRSSEGGREGWGGTRAQRLQSRFSLNQDLDFHATYTVAVMHKRVTLPGTHRSFFIRYPLTLPGQSIVKLMNVGRGDLSREK